MVTAAGRAGRGALRMLAGARIAVGLLTVVPVGAHIEEGIGEAAAWFPPLGGLIGLACGAVRLSLQGPLGAPVAAVLAVIALVVLTGALHADGLADVADALGVRGDSGRRLDVMRGSTLGAFGVLALVLWALLLIAALAALPRGHAIKTLVIACALGRWAAVAHAAVLPPARAGGLGAAFNPRPGAVALASLLAGFTVALEPVPTLAALAAAVLVTALISALGARLLGGRTGDTLGATVALTEAVIAVVLLGFAR